MLLLLLGIVLTLLGLLFKLESWEMANEMLVSGLVISLVVGVMLFSRAFSKMGSGVEARFKTPLLLLVAGVVLVFFGAISKLESWGYASEMLIVGNILQLIGMVWLVYKALVPKK